MRRTLVGVFIILLAGSAAWGQLPRGQAKAMVGGASVEIEYGRPSLNGRDMLARAQSGTVWRMGADDATTLKTSGELTVGEHTIPAGSYTLRARKESDSAWTLLVTGAGGSAVEVPLAVSTGSESVEQFTIELTGEGGSGTFAMMWGTMVAKAGLSG